MTDKETIEKLTKAIELITLVLRRIEDRLYTIEQVIVLENFADHSGDGVFVEYK